MFNRVFCDDTMYLGILAQSVLTGISCESCRLYCMRSRSISSLLLILCLIAHHLRTN